MTLETVANLAEVLTAIVAAIVAVYYWCDQRKKRVRLEDYLRKENLENPAKKTHTVLHLMANVGLKEDEILKASFRSQHIRRSIHSNRDTGLADDILFDYQA
ncbi:MAG TPA: hypothetical protein VJX69_15225 [Terriglobales bacterium]|nr:hypothetical protein [Terriglobales bacterium]